MEQKQSTYNEIIRFAESLIDAEHPATEDIIPYVSALKNETIWLRDLMTMLGIHLKHLQNYDNVTFFVDYLFYKFFLN